MLTPTLSLCMIVRDEAEMLPAFLEAAAGLYDELCVVDTGSVDATRALLAAAQARVTEMPWGHDFAAARNASLAMARGTWVLCLDADEIVSPDLTLAARGLLADGDAGAATVAVYNPLEHGYGHTAHLLRMFRRDPSIQFVHRIHEDATDSVLAYLARRGQRMVRLAGTIEHRGYSRARAAGRDKRARDGALLRACIEADGHDLYAWFKLLELGRFWQDAALLAETAPGASRALQAASPETLRAGHYVGEMLTLVSHALFPHVPADELAYLAPWQARIAPSAAYHLRCGELHELQGEPAEAVRGFEACLALRDVTANQQLATTRPLMGLARLALANREPEAAMTLLDHALRENPRDPEALLALTGLARQSGGREGSARVAAAYVAAYGECQELHGALGEVALDAGDGALAVAELRQAAGSPPQGPYAALLARAEQSQAS